jgi:hypothetical protein
MQNYQFLPFEQLSLAERAEYVLTEGSFVSKSYFYQLEISLYRINEQFIELWYDTFHNKTFAIEPMEGRSINPFLKHIPSAMLN